MKIEIGKTYLMYEFHILGEADLEKVKILDIIHMNDGKTVVRYRSNGFLFGIERDEFYEDFIKQIEKI